MKKNIEDEKEDIRMRYRIVMLIVLAAMCGLLAGTADAAPLQPQGIPGLTEVQNKQIESLRSGTETAVLQLRSDIGIKSAELKKMMVADQPDRHAIYRTMDDIAELGNRIRRLRVDTHLDIRSLLTPEQRIVFDQRVFRRMNREKRQRNGQRPVHGRITGPDVSARGHADDAETGRPFRDSSRTDE